MDDDLSWAALVPSLKALVAVSKLRGKKSSRTDEEQSVLEIQQKILIFWDLMLRHSNDPTGVSYAAVIAFCNCCTVLRHICGVSEMSFALQYEGLHLRISKTLSGKFDQSVRSPSLHFLV